MELPTKKILAVSTNPQPLLLFGPPKCGKTTKLAELEDCLIIDTEKGTRLIDALKVNVNNLKELRELYESLKSVTKQYKYLAIDTIDNIVIWFEKQIIDNYNRENEAKIQNNIVSIANSIGDLPFGSGYDAVRNKTMDTIKMFQELTENLIIIGHRKRTIIGENKVEVKVDSLDLTGKLKNLLMSQADAIGHVYRDGDALRISFKGSDELETGGRCKHLINQDIEFKWENIYK